MSKVSKILNFKRISKCRKRKFQQIKYVNHNFILQKTEFKEEVYFFITFLLKIL